MVSTRMLLIYDLFRQKNIWLTILTFIGGLILHLADTTIIILVLGVGILSFWWYWRPAPLNAESQLILEALQTYSAVIIKNHNHIIAFNSTPPILTAAYRSPLPSPFLKQCLRRGIPEIEGLELSLGHIGLEVFLLIKYPLTLQTEIKKVFQSFRGIVTYFELQLQNSFLPAERYQILRLFGLERYLDNLPLVMSLEESKKRPIRSPNPCSLDPKKLNRPPLIIKS